MYGKNADGRSYTLNMFGNSASRMNLRLHDGVIIFGMSGTDTVISEGNNNAVRIKTNYGFVEIGPQNTGYAHFQTDRSKFYFNKDIYVDGDLRPYHDSSQMLGGPSNEWLDIWANNVHTNQLCLNNDCKTSWDSNTDTPALEVLIGSTSSCNNLCLSYLQKKLYDSTKNDKFKWYRCLYAGIMWFGC